MKSNLRHKMAKVIECAITQALARDISVLASSCSDDRELIDMGKGRFSAKVLEDNFNLVWALIDASEFPCLREQATMTKVMHNIDEANKWRLSGGGTSYARMGWARWEADKIRYIWAYFLRLNARAAWSHSIRIVRLKQHYQRSMADLEPVRPLAALPDYPSSPPDVEPDGTLSNAMIVTSAEAELLKNLGSFDTQQDSLGNFDSQRDFGTLHSFDSTDSHRAALKGQQLRVSSHLRRF